MTCRAVIVTPVGPLTLLGSDLGLRALLWPDERTGRVPLPPDVVDRDHPVLAAAASQVGAWFAGERRDFDLPLDLRGGLFDLEVWRALLALPHGATTSYGALAAEVGRPGAARAIGSAVGRNPVSIVVPCHRVVGADGSLTGFAGGLDVKRALLDHEARVRDGVRSLF